MPIVHFNMCVLGEQLKEIVRIVIEVEMGLVGEDQFYWRRRSEGRVAV